MVKVASLKNPSQRAELETIAKQIILGDRRALARAITLVESARPDQQNQTAELLQLLQYKTGNALRIGFSGAPGVGKSTLIEALGLHVSDLGLKVAVLAVDPSSTRSGGSILGDKTRMERLARQPTAFIRPSPAGATLGGVARRTREAMLILEAAGYDVVLVETVGVGQNETTVANMVDMFALILAPGGGDELQGIKRGIMELADVVIVNKADGELEKVAQGAVADFRAALGLLRPKYTCWIPQIKLVSALEERGIPDVWECATIFKKTIRESGDLRRLRAEQAKAWMWDEIRQDLVENLLSHVSMADLTSQLESQVLEGTLSPKQAARRILARYREA
jgi:LAO/AO transport system kinase